jgi:hypothetical protein
LTGTPNSSHLNGGHLDHVNGGSVNGSSVEAANSFAAQLPNRVADAMVKVGDDDARPNGNGGLLNADTLRCYHDIQMLKVEIEIEAAALLRQIGETVCALTDVADALGPATAGKDIALNPESAEGRRSRIRWLMAGNDRWPATRGAASPAH